MADNIGIFNLTGSGVEAGTSSTMSSSLDLSGNLNVRRKEQRNLYDKILLGTALKSEDGESPTSGSTIPYTQQFVTIPSWTQTTMGKQHAFVISPFSSSDHETTNLNAYISGTGKLENSFIAATGTLYYSKKTRLKRLVYGVTASVFLPTGSVGFANVFPDTEEYGISRTGSFANRGFYPVSGNYFNTSISEPAVVNIFVPDYGKIRDLKVWIELIHDHRGGPGPSTGSGANTSFLHGGSGSLTGSYFTGLQNLQISLTSPNVFFKFCHPVWNSPVFDVEIINVGDQPTNSSIYDNSYLLWAGHYAEIALWLARFGNLTSASIGNSYSEFDTDIDMRTIFTDSSTNRNPRHLTPFYPNATEISAGIATGTLLDNITFAKMNMPNVVAINTFNFSGLTPHTTGVNFPWMLDSRIPPGNFVGRSYSTINGQHTNSFPPSGWMTGPNGSASINEFQTYGMQLGPNDIKPVYPLLDDIFVRRINNSPLTYISGSTTSSIDVPIKNTVEGFRPGLKGTEIHGMWQLILGSEPSVYNIDPINGVNESTGLWFRQVRLEFIVEQGQNINQTMLSKNRRFSKFTNVPSKSGQRRIEILSGSIHNSTFDGVSLDSNGNLVLPFNANWDLGINYVYSNQNEEYGRTIGITDQTASHLDSFAVFTRITGSLADRLTGSLSVRTGFLLNEFGTPYIPISVGFGNDPSLFGLDKTDSLVSKTLLNQVLHQKPLIHQANTLKATLNRNNFLQSTRAKRDEILNKLNIIEDNNFSSGSQIEQGLKLNI